MNKLIRLFPILALVVLSSCSQTGKKLPLWVEGRWETNTQKNIIGEVWEKENDTLIVGYGYILINGEQLITENISIFTSRDALFYAARVRDQNDGKEILFRATSATKDHLVFQNPEHDFPTRIVYKLANENTLEINISGRDKEDSKTIVLNRK
jgi:hypothetical protein